MDAIEKDVYVAYRGNVSTYMAMDEYTISRMSYGFFIESINTVFGINGFYQKATMYTDFQWQIQKLNVDVESLNIKMNAYIKDEKLYIQQKQQD